MICTCYSLGPLAPCPSCADFMAHVLDNYHVDSATGTDLNCIAEMYGIYRKYGETDENLRKRLIKSVTGKESEASKANKDHECECGAHKLGYTSYGMGHSTWCPMAKTSL